MRMRKIGAAGAIAAALALGASLTVMAGTYDGAQAVLTGTETCSGYSLVASAPGAIGADTEATPPYGNAWDLEDVTTGTWLDDIPLPMDLPRTISQGASPDPDTYVLDVYVAIKPDDQLLPIMGNSWALDATATWSGTYTDDCVQTAPTPTPTAIPTATPTVAPTAIPTATVAPKDTPAATSQAPQSAPGGPTQASVGSRGQSAPTPGATAATSPTDTPTATPSPTGDDAVIAPETSKTGTPPPDGGIAWWVVTLLVVAVVVVAGSATGVFLRRSGRWSTRGSGA
jgi:uncharacterized membrane protein